MIEKQDTYYSNAALIIVLGFSVFRLIYSGAFLLIPDEAYYWQWSRYPDLCYYDQSPMIGWSIRLSTMLLGNTEVAVRLPSVLSMMIVSLYLIMTANRWFGARASFYTALLTQSILGFNIAGLLATPDGLQLAGWAGACYHVARAYERDEKSHWLLGGAWFGFGLLSKYTVGMFPAFALIFGVLSAQHRKKLAGIWPYAGLALGALMFLPVIIWNASHDWSTFRHVAHKGGVDEGYGLHLDSLGDYLVSQAVLLSPLVFFILVLIWFLPFKKALTDRSWILKYCFFMSFPVFAGFALLSLRTPVEGNWPAPGYLLATVLISAFMIQTSDSVPARPSLKLLHRLWPWAIGSSFLVTSLVLVHIVWPVLPIPPKLDRLSEETRGWKQLGQKAADTVASMPRPERTFLFGVRYQIPSELAFYTPGQPRTVSINKWSRPNQYDYWWDDRDLVGWDAVGIVFGSPEKYLNRLRQVFEGVSPPERIAVYRSDRRAPGTSREMPVAEYYLYRATGFKGGLKWSPTDKRDVRAN